MVSLISSPAIDYKHLAVDDSFLYFVGANGTVINRIAVAGGDPVTVSGTDANEVVKDIALSGTQLAFVSSTRVAKVAAAGGTPSPLATGAAYALRSAGAGLDLVTRVLPSSARADSWHQSRSALNLEWNFIPNNGTLRNRR